MKKLVQLIILLTFTIGFSQIEKGDKLLGGAIVLDTGEEFYLDINPNIGYFINDRTCIGASIPMIFRDYGTHIAMSPFIRHYLKENDNKQFFGELGFDINIYSQDAKIVNRGLLNLEFGHSWFLNKNIAFEAIVKSTFINVDPNLKLTFGFQVYL